MTEPTDAELIAELEAAGVVFMAFRGGLSGTKELWTTSGSQDAKKIAAGMRAAIAKWGTPPAAAPWRSAVLDIIDECPGLTMEQDHWLSLRVKELDFASTPQPAQAQAGGVPMTCEQINAAALEYLVDDFLDFKSGVRFAEQHHGIKGGQHGAE